MAATLDPVKGRRLALAILALVIVVGVAVIALPTWLLHQRYDAALEDRHSRLERYQRIAASRPEVARQLEAMRGHDPRRFFVRSGAPALAAAEVQEVVRGVVESAGGRLITMQTLAAKEEGRYREIAISVQLTAHVVALRQVLHALETHTPYLFIENLMVRTQVPGNFKPGPGNEPEMYVSMEVHGFSLTGTP